MARRRAQSGPPEATFDNMYLVPRDQFRRVQNVLSTEGASRLESININQLNLNEADKINVRHDIHNGEKTRSTSSSGSNTTSNNNANATAANLGDGGASPIPEDSGGADGPSATVGNVTQAQHDGTVNYLRDRARRLADSLHRNLDEHDEMERNRRRDQISQAVNDSVNDAMGDFGNMDFSPPPPNYVSRVPIPTGQVPPTLRGIHDSIFGTPGQPGHRSTPILRGRRSATLASPTLPNIAENSNENDSSVELEPVDPRPPPLRRNNETSESNGRPSTWEDRLREAVNSPVRPPLGTSAQALLSSQQRNSPIGLRTRNNVRQGGPTHSIGGIGRVPVLPRARRVRGRGTPLRRLRGSTRGAARGSSQTVTGRGSSTRGRPPNVTRGHSSTSRRGASARGRTRGNGLADDRNAIDRPIRQNEPPPRRTRAMLAAGDGSPLANEENAAPENIRVRGRGRGR